MAALAWRRPGIPNSLSYRTSSCGPPTYTPWILAGAGGRTLHPGCGFRCSRIRDSSPIRPAEWIAKARTGFRRLRRPCDMQRRKERRRHGPRTADLHRRRAIRRYGGSATRAWRWILFPVRLFTSRFEVPEMSPRLCNSFCAAGTARSRNASSASGAAMRGGRGLSAALRLYGEHQQGGAFWAAARLNTRSIARRHRASHRIRL